MRRLAPVKGGLEAAILSATPKRLQAVLINICGENADAYNITRKALLVESVKTELVPVDTESKRDTIPARHRREPLEPNWDICTRCQETYDITDNDEDVCQWHRGTPNSPSAARISPLITTQAKWNSPINRTSG